MQLLIHFMYVWESERICAFLFMRTSVHGYKNSTLHTRKIRYVSELVLPIHQVEVGDWTQHFYPGRLYLYSLSHFGDPPWWFSFIGKSCHSWEHQFSENNCQRWYTLTIKQSGSSSHYCFHFPKAFLLPNICNYPSSPFRLWEQILSPLSSSYHRRLLPYSEFPIHCQGMISTTLC